MATASYRETQEDILALWRHQPTRQRPVLLRGEPGCGKSAMGTAIAEALGATLYMTHPPRQNPVNYSGFPRDDNGQMTWSEPKLMHQLSTGINVLMIEEIGQCGATMQNVMAGLALDRKTNEVKVSDDTLMILTTNRVEDKAGAKPIMTHLADRCFVRDVEYTIDDFKPYALSRAYIDPYGVAFLDRAPQHLKSFDPNRTINASPRSWDMALSIDSSLPRRQLQRLLCDVLPEGIVVEYMEFRAVADSLPSVAEVLEKPDTLPVPDDVDVRYVMTATLATTVNQRKDVKLFERLMVFVNRLPPELQTLFVHSTVTSVPALTSCKAYTDWQIATAKARGSV